MGSGGRRLETLADPKSSLLKQQVSGPPITLVKIFGPPIGGPRLSRQRGAGFSLRGWTDKGPGTARSLVYEKRSVGDVVCV